MRYIIRILFSYLNHILLFLPANYSDSLFKSINLLLTTPPICRPILWLSILYLTDKNSPPALVKFQERLSLQLHMQLFYFLESIWQDRYMPALVCLQLTDCKLTSGSFCFENRFISTGLLLWHFEFAGGLDSLKGIGSYL